MTDGDVLATLLARCEAAISGGTLDWLNALATLVAAGGGVLIAFALERSTRSRDENSKKREAINYALFALIHYWNRLESIDHDILEPARHAPNRWFVMATSIDPGDPLPPAPDPTGRLQFLLGDGKHADLYARILLQEQRYRTYNFLLLERNREIAEAWRRLSTAGLAMGASITPDQFVGIVGQDLAKRLQVMGDALYEHFDQNFRSLIATIEELRREAKTIFPKESFISFEPTRRKHSSGETQ